MRACVGLGSNLGDRLAMLRSARAAIDTDARSSVVAASRVYETDPVGPGDQERYLNAAVVVVTDRSPRELLELLLRIELELGRDRSADAVRWGPRTIDLDLLLAGDRCIDEPGLHVPHPRLHERAFVLMPLAEVAGEVVHPTLGRSIGELEADVPGRERVDRLDAVSAGHWGGEEGVGRTREKT